MRVPDLVTKKRQFELILEACHSDLYNAADIARFTGLTPHMVTSFCKLLNQFGHANRERIGLGGNYGGSNPYLYQSVKLTLSDSEVQEMEFSIADKRNQQRGGNGISAERKTKVEKTPVVPGKPRRVKMAHNSGKGMSSYANYGGQSSIVGG